MLSKLSVLIMIVVCLLISEQTFAHQNYSSVGENIVVTKAPILQLKNNRNILMKMSFGLKTSINSKHHLQILRIDQVISKKIELEREDCNCLDDCSCFDCYCANCSMSVGCHVTPVAMVNVIKLQKGVTQQLIKLKKAQFFKSQPHINPFRPPIFA